jgi:hypothetical protein
VASRGRRAPCSQFSTMLRLTLMMLSEDGLVYVEGSADEVWLGTAGPQKPMRLRACYFR